MWIVYLQMIFLISKYCKRETTDNKVLSFVLFVILLKEFHLIIF